VVAPDAGIMSFPSTTTSLSRTCRIKPKKAEFLNLGFVSSFTASMSIPAVRASSSPSKGFSIGFAWSVAGSCCSDRVSARNSSSQDTGGENKKATEDLMA